MANGTQVLTDTIKYLGMNKASHLIPRSDCKKVLHCRSPKFEIAIQDTVTDSMNEGYKTDIDEGSSEQKQMDTNVRAPCLEIERMRLLKPESG